MQPSRNGVNEERHPYRNQITVSPYANAHAHAHARRKAPRRLSCAPPPLVKSWQNSKAVRENFNPIPFTMQLRPNEFWNTAVNLNPYSLNFVRQAIPVQVVLLCLLQTRTAFRRFRWTRRILIILDYYYYLKTLPALTSFSIFKGFIYSIHFKLVAACFSDTASLVIVLACMSQI